MRTVGGVCDLWSTLGPTKSSFIAVGHWLSLREFATGLPTQIGILCSVFQGHALSAWKNCVISARINANRQEAGNRAREDLGPSCGYVKVCSAKHAKYGGNGGHVWCTSRSSHSVASAVPEMRH
jgi:hypothetical protein